MGQSREEVNAKGPGLSSVQVTGTRAGFLNLETTDILARIILPCEGLLCALQKFNSILGFYLY